MSTSKSNKEITEEISEQCPECFRKGYYPKGEVCDGCANIDDYRYICCYCNKINYTNDSDICDPCLQILSYINLKH